MSIIIGGI